MLTKERIDKHALQAVDCPPATWVVLRSAMHRLVDKESAATAPLLARIAELERELEEARKVLKETGLLLHHFWCDVQMNEYSFDKLNKGIEAIDAAIGAKNNG